MISTALARQRVSALGPSPCAGPNRSPMAWSQRHRAVGTIAVGLVVLFVAGPIGVAFMGLVWFSVDRARPLLQARRARAAAVSQLPDALELFVLMVHAGLTPRHAIDKLAATAPSAVRHGFLAVVARLERGEALADALRALPDHLGHAALGLADLVGSADRYGLPLAPVLDQLAVQARADRRRVDEAAARALPVKLTFPLVVCTLPSFVLLAIVPAVMAALSSLQATPW